MSMIFDPIYVQFGILKQKLHPYETLDDLSFLTNGTICMDDCVQVVGLTLNKLKKALRFGVPRSTTATRNGIRLADHDLIEPGDEVECLECGKPTVPHATSESRSGIEDDYDPSKLLVTQQDLSAHYQGRRCFLGNTKSLALLERLGSRPGIYIPLHTLRRDVWGHDSLVADESIQKQISILREKLRKGGLNGITIDGNQQGHYRLVLSQ